MYNFGFFFFILLGIMVVLLNVSLFLLLGRIHFGIVGETNISKIVFFGNAILIINCLSIAADM